MLLKKEAMEEYQISELICFNLGILFKFRIEFYP